jgi:hypothetical protein
MGGVWDNLMGSGGHNLMGGVSQSHGWGVGHNLMVRV